jgi:hypothetical protein
VSTRDVRLAPPATGSEYSAATSGAIVAPAVLEAPPRAAPGRLRGLGRRMRRQLGGIPVAAWICALVAFTNGVAWSVIVPPFQTPDEPSHFAYAQHLAETGQLPSSSSETFPPAEEIALADLLQSEVRFSRENHPISSVAEQRRLEFGLSLPLSRSEPGNAGLAASEPPLYYALQTIPYKLASSGTLLDQLALMRLLSALIGGFTALFAFLFLREALPGERWAWTIGALSVALMPLFGMMSGAVNPDSLLFAVSTVLFYGLARAFRRGLSPRLAICIGATIAAGCLTKLNFLGLLPGTALGLFALALRETRMRIRGAMRLLAPTVAVAAAPVCLYVLLDASAGYSTTSLFSSTTNRAGDKQTIWSAVGYLWQLYLPRLPGMSHAFHGTSGGFLWFNALVGQYGWLDTSFPAWVVRLALVPAALIVALFIGALFANRDSLRARWLEVAVYCLMGLGLLALIGLEEYINAAQGEYLEARYLLPTIALMGSVLALAARGAGRRWGPLAGTVIVLLFLAHDLFSQLLVVSRYYG